MSLNPSTQGARLRPSRFPRRLRVAEKPSVLARLLNFFFPDDTKIKVECTTNWTFNEQGLRLTRRFYTFRSFFFHYTYTSYALLIRPFQSYAKWKRSNPYAPLWEAPQFGGIAYDNKTSGTQGISFLHTCTGSNLVLVGGQVHTDDSTGYHVTSMTYNSVTLTKQINDYVFLNAEASYRHLDIEYLASPATGANLFVVNYDAANIRSKVGGCISLSGCDTASPVDSGTTSTSHAEGVKTTAPAISVTTANANTMLLEFGNLQDTTGITTVGGSETQRWQTADNTQGTCAGTTSTRATTTAGSYTNTWTASGNYVGGWVTGIIGINEAVTSFTQACNEVVVLADSALKYPQRQLSEAVALVDTALKSTTRTLNEVAIIADSVTKNTTRLFSEAVVIADSILKTTTHTLSEAITLADSIISNTARLLSEAIMIVDTTVRSITRNFSEVIAIVDVAERTIQRIYTEVITLADTLTKTAGKLCAETVVLADTITRAVTKLVNEVLIIADSVLKAAERTLSEAIMIVDAITRQMTLVLTQDITLSTTLTVIRRQLTSIGNFTIRSLYGAARTLYEKTRVFSLRNN